MPAGPLWNKMVKRHQTGEDVVEFRQVRSRRVALGLFLVGPAALFEVRNAGGTVIVSGVDLSDTLGIGGRDYQEMTTTAARLHAAGDPGWVQLPYGGVVHDE